MRKLAPRVADLLRHGNVTVLAITPNGYDQDANPGSSSVDSWEFGDLSEGNCLAPMNCYALRSRFGVLMYFCAALVRLLHASRCLV